MAKKKVFELAEEFKMSSTSMVQMLRGMGIPVKSHMSTVDEELRTQIKEKFEAERAEMKKRFELKKQAMQKAQEEIEAATAPALPPAAPAPAPAAPASAVQPPPAQTATRAQSGHSAAAAGAQSERQRGDSQGQHQRKGPPIRKYHQKESWAKGSFAPSSSPSSPHPHHGHGHGGSTSPAADTRNAPPPKTAAPGGVLDDKKSAPTSGKPDKHKKKGNKYRNERPEINEIELKANVKKTLAKIGTGATKKKYKKEADQRDDTADTEKKVLKVAEFVTPNELANMMNVTASDVITKCLEMGAFVTINQRLDFETIELVVDEFGYTASLMDEYAADDEAEEASEEIVGALLPRAPVVTVMGHVDHGKTSLLDYIRKTNVIAGESGGITQHIAAYEVKTKHGPVTFLDTPGHEAFTAMRARGSQITDVIVLVVAADSAVMPQTREAIDHARAASVPLVVAINKVDLPTANPEKIKGELASYNVLVEEYGGQVSCVEISAKTGHGIDKLLETLALETEILELKATSEGKAHGVVIEAELDKGKGPIATVLIQRGTLTKGNAFVTGIHSGRVRELHNERGQIVESAGPSQPVLILGMSGTPQAGDSFRVMDDEKEAREISARRRLAQKEREMRRIDAISLDNLHEKIKAGSVQNLNLIIKGDVDGSVEALAASLEKLSTPEIKVRVIHKSVGAVKETDIMLGVASNALIIGFHLSPNTKIRDLAKKEGVEIRTYRIIYEAVDAVHLAMEGMLKPEIRENVLAEIVVRKVFKVSKIGTIAGCMVESGTLNRNSKARVIRDDVELAESKISSLKRVQEDVREVQSGYECGIMLDRFSDFQEGDRIITFEEIEVARKLTKQ
ncbi:MAG: translation initiation factor IF-2 [Chitinispirillia bacterium]|nr:translation initiation factor IF-2 [Chitinispirillia bacterium]MCL2267865.1 translation initiation factor IF-2 [Chitinispirillia bacterium]